MNNGINIEQILKDNLKDYLSKEVDNEIKNKVEEFEYKLKNDKDKYVEYLMKNIIVFHERNFCDNGINYTITFVNEYVTKEKNNEISFNSKNKR